MKTDTVLFVVGLAFLFLVIVPWQAQRSTAATFGSIG